jgi:hypothetical protein
LPCSRQEVTLRLALACSRKMRPIMTLRQPMEKRKKAATSAKSSTWCERMAAPILRGITWSTKEWRKMTVERDVQALHDTECAQAKFGPKHGKIPVEEFRRPTNLREEEHDDLEDEE